jgi:hypothetical protein
MALSIAREKDTKRLDEPLLETVKAGLPKHTVLQAAVETAEKIVRLWSEMAGALPLDRRVEETAVVRRKLKLGLIKRYPSALTTRCLGCLS